MRGWSEYMWIINKNNIVNLTRRWLYVVTVMFWAFGVLVPVSVISYWTFYKILIPLESIKVPLSNFPNTRTQNVAQLDIQPFVYQFNKQTNLQYLVRFNLEVFCNRNREDDIYPVLTNVSVVNTMQKQFILNCDSRYIYHKNNWFIPYNLRFWLSPFLSNINKSVFFAMDYFVVSGHDVLKDTQKMTVELENPLIVGQASTNVEFMVQWDGFRYYLVKYPIISFLVGVSIFWSFAATATSFVALLIVLFHVSKREIEYGFPDIKEEPLFQEGPSYGEPAFKEEPTYKEPLPEGRFETPVHPFVPRVSSVTGKVSTGVQVSQDTGTSRRPIKQEDPDT